VSASNGGNQQVIRTDWCAGAFEVRADPRIGFGARIIKREGGEGREECAQLGQRALRYLALLRTEKQLCLDNCAQRDVLRRETLQTIANRW
jgi:hypothetical protein